MNEIDQMDMLGFLKVRAWDASREVEKSQPQVKYIDQVWPTQSVKN